MVNTFYVQPAIATQGAMQGLGSLAQAGGQYFANERAQDQRGQQTQAFMTLIGQANSAGDPAEKQRLMTQAFVEFPEQAKQLVNQTKLMREQEELTSPAEEKTKYTQGTGAMSGYAFDPSTGSFIINPEVKQALEDKATAKAEKGAKLGAKDRQGINKDVTGLIKGTAEIVKSAKSLAGLKESSSPAAQLAAVFSFMKAMDPSSTVRESEQGQVYNAQGAAKGIANKINALIGKGGLSQEGFQDLVDTANNLANTAIDSSSGEIRQYLDSYEDTLPDSFKERLTNRLPARLGVAPQKTVKWSDY